MFQTSYKPTMARPIKPKPKETGWNTETKYTKSDANHRLRTRIDSTSTVQIIINDLLER